MDNALIALDDGLDLMVTDDKRKRLVACLADESALDTGEQEGLSRLAAFEYDILSADGICVGLEVDIVHLAIEYDISVTCSSEASIDPVEVV